MFLVASSCLLLGGFVGAYATASLHGQTEPILVVQSGGGGTKPSCPACAECPRCPAPVDCGERGVIPTTTRSALHPLLAPQGDDSEPHRTAGLPATAIQAASRTVWTEIAPCIKSAGERQISGSIVLDLTVTATGGKGFIRETDLLVGPDGVTVADDIRECLVEGADRAEFPWEGSDGEARFRLPVRLKPD